MLNNNSCGNTLYILKSANKNSHSLDIWIGGRQEQHGRAESTRSRFDPDLKRCRTWDLGQII